MMSIRPMIGTQISAKVLGLPDVSTVRVGDTVSGNLASSFGNLTKESYKRMDKEMKAVIGYTIQNLNRTSDRSWSGTLRCMNGNNLLKPKPGSAREKNDRLHKGGVGVFKTDGSPSQAIMNEIRSWFVNLVSDADVLKDTHIDIDKLARMVAQTGASVDSFGAFFHKSVHERKDALNVSVLRFPDIDRPFFKVYRIHLIAYRDCERTLFVQKDSSGINGMFNEVCYSPVQEVLDRLKPEVLDAAVKEADDLFND